MRNVYAALSKEFKWENNKENMEDKEATTLVGVQHSSVMKRLLRRAVNELSEQKFGDVDRMLDRYESFLKYSTKEKATSIKVKVSVHEHKILKGRFKVNNEYLV